MLAPNLEIDTIYSDFQSHRVSDMFQIAFGSNLLVTGFVFVDLCCKSHRNFLFMTKKEFI